MIIFPATDILDGQCVRLQKGEYATASQVAEDLFATARSFAAAGAVWLHAVDLNGAREGTDANRDLILRLAKESGLKVEVGGGIRTMDTVRSYLENGVARVILGSVALKNPSLVTEAVGVYGDRIAVGIDAKEGNVKSEGWTEGSGTDYLTLAKVMAASGVRHFIFTDIDCDGMLCGPNLTQLTALRDALPSDCRITASGGIRDLRDIRALRALGLYGAICGKSIYAGTLSLREAIAEAEGGIF